MKSKLIIATLAIAGLAINASAQIESSAHDFSGSAWNSSGKICLPCHTPHSSLSTLVPLWNHASTTNSFTLYTGGADFDATDVGQPSGASLACLSCHDGTVALDSFGGSTTGSVFLASVKASAVVGTDLSNDHPVSFTYDDTLANTDGSLHTPSDTTPAGLGGTIAEKMLFGVSDNQLECASCHDVHNATGFDGLLRIDNAGSDLCLACHDK